jgi:hypothetical protein
MSLALFYALYCVEAGLFFTVVPWTRIWTMNSLLHSMPAVALLADNPFMRGFVSGVGVLHLIVGVRELFRLLRARRGSSAS